MSRSPTPIALFAYNRPRHVDRALTALARRSRFRECSLHIYCDGPRDDKDGPAVGQTRLVVRNWASQLKAKVIERPENLGLARSIVAGVTELCAKHGRVIVIEDDHQVGPGFLAYMLDALDRYRDEKNVYQVSGYMFPVDQPSKPDAFFLPLTTTWGWATWERAWQLFDWDVSDAREQLADPDVRRRFDLLGGYPYTRLLEERLNGRNDSWGILWWWAVFRVGGLVLHPRRSLVCVGGFDGSGTHCGHDDGGAATSPSETLRVRFGQPITFPAKVIADEPAFRRVIRFLKGKHHTPHQALELEAPSCLI